jgi:precorrin-2 dehydrogenase/sirohydrochlorin ferrochelatase/precorrin-6A/cobalt-precorrin-6A reductase
MIRLLVFAGTVEGRLFIEEFRRAVNGPCLMRVFTATKYGKELLSLALPGDSPSVEIRPGRLDAEAMYREILLFKPAYVVDCTHPYAAEARRNIQDACERSRCEYLRLRRDASPMPADVSAVSVDTVAEAALYLRDQEGNILVTTGSKDLEPFTEEALRNRVFLRVLPLEESIEKCRSLGFPSRNIIAMQGPFSEDLNRALIRQFKVSWLLTKESGGGGGYPEKLRAACREGIPVVVVRRPREDRGRSLREILDILLDGPRRKKPRWFPVFLDISGKRVLVVGGGKIALRRVRTLLKFDCALTILTEALSGELRELVEGNRDRVNLYERPYAPGDCGTGADFVLALTDKREVNRLVAEEARSKGIPVSVADYQGDSTFYFPAVVNSGGLVIGLSAGGENHRLVKEAAEKVRALFENAADGGGGTVSRRERHG